MELRETRPVYLDDLSHKMRVVKYFGRPSDEICVDVEMIDDYPDSHHLAEEPPL
jgi:hypothetical protein